MKPGYSLYSADFATKEQGVCDNHHKPSQGFSTKEFEIPQMKSEEGEDGFNEERYSENRIQIPGPATSLRVALQC